MALIALGAVACTLGGGITSHFSFGGSQKVSDSGTKISAEGAINNVIVKDVQDKIELKNPVAMILYILCNENHCSNIFCLPKNHKTYV